MYAFTKKLLSCLKRDNKRISREKNPDVKLEMSEEPSLTCAGDILTLAINDMSLKCKIPRGPAGPPGRDGMNIKGDKGEQGVPGDCGRDGRDSVIPGPVGDIGCMGPAGPVPKISMGSIVVGEEPSAVISRDTDIQHTLNLVIPRGLKGEMGPKGKDGKHGTHEKISYNSFGNNPRFMNEMFATHFLADGDINLPVLGEANLGDWFCCKTLNRLCISGLIEGFVVLEKNDSAKFVCVPYGGEYKFTKF
jgi:hypothetical protein